MIEGSLIEISAVQKASHTCIVLGSDKFDREKLDRDKFAIEHLLIDQKMEESDRLG